MTSNFEISDGDYIEGEEDQYTTEVPALNESHAIRPGSTKIKDVCIKPVTVNCDLLHFLFYFMYR